MYNTAVGPYRSRLIVHFSLFPKKMPTEKKQTNRIDIRLNPDEYQRIAKAAETAEISNAEYARRKILTNNKIQTKPTRIPHARYRQNVDRAAEEFNTIRLTQSEENRANEIAKESGISRATLLVKIIRTALFKRAQPIGELAQAIRDANRQLSGIAANLNQLARHANEHPEKTNPIAIAYLERLSKNVEEHREQLHEIIKASIERWG